VRLNVNVLDGIVVLRPQGEVNFENTSMISQAIRERLDSERHFLLDLTNVPYMDSTSLGTVLDALRSVRSRDGDLRLAGLADNVRRVFDLMDAGRVLRIFTTPEEGLMSFAQSAEARERA